MLKRIASLAVAFIALAGAASAGASENTPIASGSLTLHSAPGEPIGQGQSYSYVFPQESGNVATNGTNRIIVSAPTPFGWSLMFQAPAGGALTVGKYTNASTSSDDTHAGLSVYGLGRGCMIIGEFEVLAVEFTSQGYLRRFHATFTQRCDTVETPPLTGEIDIATPDVAVGVQLEPREQVKSRVVDVAGTVTCTQNADYTVRGTVTQTPLGLPSRSASFTASGVCSPIGLNHWSARAVAPVTFMAGPATIRVRLTTPEGRTASTQGVQRFAKLPGRAVYVGPKLVRFTKQGNVRLPIRCPSNEGVCDGFILIRVTMRLTPDGPLQEHILVQSQFGLSPGMRSVGVIPLSAVGRRIVRRAGYKRVTLRVTTNRGFQYDHLTRIVIRPPL